MLWYKAWLETRLRFLICVAGLTALCAYNAYRTVSGVTSPVNLAYYHSGLHNVTSQLTIFWLLAVNLTTMGGLLREKAVGAASFTLALPFSRARMAGVRMAAGLVEAMLLVAVPWAAIFATGAIFGKTHSAEQALLHLGYMTSGGVVYYAIALFSSCVVEGEYTGLVISFGIVIVAASMLDGPSLRAYNPGGFMTGGNSYNVRQGLLVGPIPWEHAAAYVLLAACLALISVKAIQAREF
jgi:ABC-2 type transport system permease protein